MKIKHLATEKDTTDFAAQLATIIPSSTIIFLEGSLGAGKTTFTRGFLRALGVTSKIKSPTYTLVEPYEIAGKKIFHFDLYRLVDANELEQIGIRDYFAQEAICIIEWPEKGSPLLPAADIVCHITFAASGRKLSMQATSEKGEQILQRIT